MDSTLVQLLNELIRLNGENDTLRKQLRDTLNGTTPVVTLTEAGEDERTSA